MTEGYQYFTIPFDSVPASPNYDAWFAVTSPDRPGVTWSTVRPDATASLVPTWVVGIIENAPPPPEGTVIGRSGKCVPPPPLGISPSTAKLKELQEVLAAWLKQVAQARSA